MKRLVMVFGAVVASLGGAESAPAEPSFETAAAEVPICHRTGSPHQPYFQMKIALAALPAHVRHGDTVGGTCPPPGRP